MKHASLFSGIGGFDLAAEWMGWENIFHCEIESFPKKILNYYWPNAISYDNIKQTDFTIHRGTIDVLTGGFPCQPYSVAGKRKGKEDDRHLWPEMLRAIREIQPGWVVGENVRGITTWNGGLVFNEVQADLEAEGYEILPFLLPACGVNAPHERYRIWVVAYNSNARIESVRQQWENSIYEVGITSDTQGPNKQRNGLCKKQQEREAGRSRSGTNRKRVITNPECSGRIQNNLKFKTKKHKYVIPCWDRFPTQSPVCNGNDGFSSKLDGITFPKWRSESIKSGGNAIVPQEALQMFKVIHNMHKIL